MSNRSILADEKLQAEFRQTLEDLVKNIPDNRTCADCGVKGPRWTSTNLGVFICTRCAGIHRSLGTHISKVKSIDLDNWTPEHVETLRRIGNALAKQVFEHAIPSSYRRPATSGHVGTETLELWIRDKYEHKSFTDKQAYHQVYVLGATSTGRQTTTAVTQPHTSQSASHVQSQPRHAHPTHHTHSQPHHGHSHAHQPHHTPQHRPPQQSSELLLVDFGATNTAPLTATPMTTATPAHQPNNRGKDFLDTIEFSQFQTASTTARPTTAPPQSNGTQPTAAQPKQSTAQNMQDTKSILMQLYNTTPNAQTPNTTGFGAQNTSAMGGQTMMPGQPMMMLAPGGGMMTPQTMQTPGMMMMNPAQGSMMMHQGQPVMMTPQGQMMMGTQPLMYGNQFYYPAQGTMQQYPAQSHVPGQYVQNTAANQFQQPSQFR